MYIVYDHIAYVYTYIDIRVQEIVHMHYSLHLVNRGQLGAEQ